MNRVPKHRDSLKIKMSLFSDWLYLEKHTKFLLEHAIQLELKLKPFKQFNKPIFFLGTIYIINLKILKQKKSKSKTVPNFAVDYC